VQKASLLLLPTIILPVDAAEIDRHSMHKGKVSLLVADIL
jgi:hypothetical protein